MTVCRLPHHDGNYTIISNSIFTDGRLSGRAIGVLVSLLSKPADWRINAESIAKTMKEGRDAIRAALRELKALGYIVYKKIQDPETGQWSTVSTVYEVPVEVDGDEEPQESVTPRPGNPTAGTPTVGEPGPNQMNDDKGKKQTTSEPSPEAPPAPRRARKAVVVDSVSDERLKGIRDACLDKGLPALWGTLSQDKADAIAELVDQHGVEALAAHALKMHSTSNPTRHAGGLLLTWQSMPRTGNRKPAKPAVTCENNCYNGWYGKDWDIPCPTCRPNLAVSA